MCYRDGMWQARLALLVLALQTAACATAAAPVGRVGISIDDARVVAAVRTAIVNDPELGLRQIAVESKDGVVTVSGGVGSSGEGDRLVQLARGVTGVRDVKSNLRIEPSASPANRPPGSAHQSTAEPAVHSSAA